MGTRTGYPPGTFSWVDLATPDPEAAKAFYASVFSWEPEDMPAGVDRIYTMFRRDDEVVAGLYGQSEDQRAAKVPPAWTSFVTVGSADETAARAKELGGEVVTEAFDVLHAGRVAGLRDPTGALVAAWEPYDFAGAGRVNEPGCLCWNDLVTPNAAVAERFYEALFSWTVEEPPGGGGYRIIRNGERTNGGIMPTSLIGMDVPPHWLAYFNAGVLETALRRVREGGGKVVAGPVQLPAGRIALATDPLGAAFALFEGTVDD